MLSLNIIVLVLVDAVVADIARTGWKLEAGSWKRSIEHRSKFDVAAVAEILLVVVVTVVVVVQLQNNSLRTKIKQRKIFLMYSNL